MGVVNVTPDSFSDGGVFFDADQAVAQGVRLAEEGADIIDIGGESTRPFSEGVSEKEEFDRVLPVIERLAGLIAVPISIDTTKSRVAEAAVAAGAAVINDVSALRADDRMAATAAACNVPLILMHMLGTPKTMQTDPTYQDVVADVKAFLADAVQRALSAGVDRSMILIDPGIGFGKTVAHNLALINRLDELSNLNLPILVGPSRKAFIRKLLKGPQVDDISPSLPVVATGTQAAVAAAALRGAHVVRVHDVARTVATLKIIDALKIA
jgi:dihydropteroate synthase